ncbi:cobyric acid synthase [Actinomarinicola tropica]|uniref:Cobyric acid synthase n=1 Tax=Actinomarinicola tropica TaxID=2789776 RepID=A0A5Q2RH73_9ACTN|nr:cobyric acid synthase [Actinomarinicola tropica]QGG96178.1 cobyric acid synthase [Actinomarinicola tropica]
MSRSLAVWGTTSGAGKSLVTTGLARWFARQGVRVVPFKAQNMSNHARVVEGGEIGAAQWLQALAAGVDPDVRMNPVLTKPEADGRSQVVVLGQVDEDLSRAAWRGRATSVWPRVVDALDDLRADADLVLVEGAGSPAETNLADVDLANLATADHLDAPALLLADIDRGGAFAHLFGTWSLVPDDHRHRIAGFVLNRFRGDPTLLAPAPEELSGRTGVPTIGVLPELAHRLPDEDGASFAPVVRGGRPRVGVVRYPTASNLDELAGVVEVADVVAATEPRHLVDAELIVLPGAKHVTSDAAWLRTSGVGAAIRGAAEAGVRVLGICGGAQLLGEDVVDADGVEGPAGVRVDGLGLLPLRTELHRAKVVRATTIELPRELARPWEAVAGRRARAYEIHHGHTGPTDDGRQVWSHGPVLAVTAHGLLEDPDVVEVLLGRRPTGLDATFDLLADAVEEHLDTEQLRRIAGFDG